MKEKDYKFRPVDLSEPADIEIALRFRREAYRINLGEGSWEVEGGDAPYLESRRAMTHDNPETVQFFLVDCDIAGMIEYDSRTIDDVFYGYALFYFLDAPYRGKGYGQHLDAKVCDKFKTMGHDKARLTTIATNTQAVNFYIRQEWRVIGKRTGMHKDAIYLEKNLI